MQQSEKKTKFRFDFDEGHIIVAAMTWDEAKQKLLNKIGLDEFPPDLDWECTITFPADY